MASARSLIVLAGVTLAVVVGAVLLKSGGDAIPGRGELLFPDLLSRVDEVRGIRALSGGETFHLTRDEARWRLAERDGYRVAADKVHKLVVGAAGLVRIEPKTSNPDLYDRIGLGDPARADSGSIRFTLLDAGGGALADFVVGNREPSRIDLALEEFYLRRFDDPQSWLVEGRLSVSRDPIQWLDREILDIDATRVRAVQVHQAGGGVVEVGRRRPEDPDFRLDNAPPGHEVAEQWRIDDVGRGLTDLRLEEVRRAAAERSGDPDFTATLSTFDGLRVRLSAHREEGASYARLDASFDETARDPRFGPAGGDTEGVEGIEGLLAAPEVQEEARRLNEGWQGWEYRLAEFKRSYFATPVEELVKRPGSGE